MRRRAMCAVPPMGWNSWNTFAEKINEDLIKETVDVMKEEGFREAGYEYVVMVSDEIALHRKLFGRSLKEYMCLDCQAIYLGVERGYLEKLIERYHKDGTCALFAKWE